MSLSVGKAQLNEALSELRIKWDRTRTMWNDPVSASIEKEYLSPLEPRIRSTIAAMTRMQEITAKARRECS